MKKVNLNHSNKLIAMKFADAFDLIGSVLLIIIFPTHFKNKDEHIAYNLRFFFRTNIIFFSLIQACLFSFLPIEKKKNQRRFLNKKKFKR